MQLRTTIGSELRVCQVCVKDGVDDLEVRTSLKSERQFLGSEVSERNEICTAHDGHNDKGLRQRPAQAS